MTVTELNNEFDIHYNSIAGMSAPGIDTYEKSVYLSKAQLEIVKDAYDALSNRKKKGFEGSEKRRVDLKELVKDFKSSSTLTSTNGIDPNSKFFEIPDDVFLIVQETAKLGSSDTCINGTIANIIPVTHDEYNVLRKNPFKRPDKDTIWRLNVSKESTAQVVELVSPNTISEYHLRYIKYPKPIILGNLGTLYPGESLSIDGLSTSRTSELHEAIHREIVDRAVELALRDYRLKGLESKIQMDTRNE